MVDEAKKPVKLELVQEEELAIAKPGAFDLSKFKSTHVAAAGVETLLGPLPHHKISDARDFVMLHPDERYWSPELCFVNVPIKGMKRETLHLIFEEIALKHLPPARVQRFRLALASKPNNVFFLCHVPTQNFDNTWNSTNQMACEAAKLRWTQVTSRREENIDGYKIDYAKNQAAFHKPDWPKQSLDELIAVTFAGRMIDNDNHPGLLRLIGDVQPLA